MNQTEPEDTDRRAAQRVKILAGARLAFARDGAATMADVAAAAGVSQGLAYRYFASKEAIYRELVEQALEQLSQQQDGPPADGLATPGERLARLIAAVLEQRRDHPAVFQLLDQALSAGAPHPSLLALIRQRREAFLGELRQLICDGQAAGEVAAGDPDQLVLAVTAALDGLARVALRDPEQFKRLCPDPAILLRMLLPQR